MRGISRRTIAGAVATLAVAGAVGGATVAGADQARGGGGGGNPATVSAELDGRELFFDGADEVKSGSRLRFVNNTRPRQVGPHTFSLVQKDELPDTRKQQRRCFRGDNVCNRIAVAHRVNFQTGEVNRPVVDRGEEGWDKRFGRSGDSFVSEEKGDKHTRKVRVDAGGTLWFLCAIHPEMQTKVDVVD